MTQFVGCCFFFSHFICAFVFDTIQRIISISERPNPLDWTCPVNGKQVQGNVIGYSCYRWEKMSWFWMMKAKKYLGTSQNWIFGCIVWMVLWWNLQNSWQWWCMCIDHMTNQFSVTLIYQNNINVIAFDETLETLFNLANWCVYTGRKLKSNGWMWNEWNFSKKIFLTFVHHHKVGMTIFIDFTNTSQ